VSRETFKTSALNIDKPFEEALDTIIKTNPKKTPPKR
jgi:hypothetical protein